MWLGHLITHSVWVKKVELLTIAFKNEMRKWSDKMNFKDYLARPELSASGVKNLAVSPAYFKWKKENPKDTGVMRIGRCLHSAILTPEDFKKDFAQVPQCDKRTKEGRAIFEAFQILAVGKECIKFEEYNHVLAIRDSVLKSPKIVNMLSKGESEKTLFFEIEGVKMKSRLDFLADKFFLDIKTTQSANSDNFARDSVKLGYDLQMWIYAEAIRQNFEKDLPCIIFAIEKESNLDYAIFQLGQEWMDLGERKARKLIKLYKECLEKDEWPGYDKNVQQLSLPAWVKMEE